MLSVVSARDKIYPQNVDTDKNGSNHHQILSVLPPQETASAENLETIYELQQIPVERVQVDPASRIVFHTDPSGAAADRFRFLRMRLRELGNSKKLKSLLITSPLPEDGKSTITLNLATALAEAGKRTVLLIEADLHHSPLIEQLKLEPQPGLAECLEQGLNPILAVRRLEPLGWYLLPAGKPSSNPTELLQTEAFSGVMRKLSPHFDWVLIDSPPIAPLTDALSLRKHANASLVVARAGHTPSESIDRAIALLGREHVLGVILNGVEADNRLYYGYSGTNGFRKTKPTDKQSQSLLDPQIAAKAPDKEPRQQ
jgi:capsular exopolysaccharide synthesis family protein